jgi:hypothetical protein
MFVGAQVEVTYCGQYALAASIANVLALLALRRNIRSSRRD